VHCSALICDFIRSDNPQRLLQAPARHPETHNHLRLGTFAVPNRISVIQQAGAAKAIVVNDNRTPATKTSSSFVFMCC